MWSSKQLADSFHKGVSPLGPEMSQNMARCAMSLFNSDIFDLSILVITIKCRAMTLSLCQVDCDICLQASIYRAQICGLFVVTAELILLSETTVVLSDKR